MNVREGFTEEETCNCPKFERLADSLVRNMRGHAGAIHYAGMMHGLARDLDDGPLAYYWKDVLGVLWDTL